MTRRRFFVLGTVALVGVAVSRPGFADVRREVTGRRPYIVEIGAPYSIGLSTLEREAARISALREYVTDYGYPDYTEIQEIEPEWPWESYEVRTYYMQRNLEMDFGHIFLSPAMPQFGMIKFQGDIPSDKRHQIEVILQAREAPPAPPAPQPAPLAEAPAAPPAAAPAAQQPRSGGLTEALVARIEAAAERAAQAADQAAEQSEAAVRAADRTTSIVNKMIESAGPTENSRQ